MSIAFCAIRTRNRLDRLILLIPYWESHRADPEEKQGPASDIRHRSGKTARKRLTLNRRIEKCLFIPMARSASDASDHFCIPEDRAVEVGARITICPEQRLRRKGCDVMGDACVPSASPTKRDRSQVDQLGEELHDGTEDREPDNRGLSAAGRPSSSQLTETGSFRA